MAVIFCFITFLMNIKRTDAQLASIVSPIPFGTAVLGPQITRVDVCCNGLFFTISGNTASNDPALATQYSKLVGDYIFPWQNMSPVPESGLGFYQWWSVSEDSKVLGSKTPSGVCVTVESECESTESVDWTVQQMGTNLISFTGF